MMKDTALTALREKQLNDQLAQAARQAPQDYARLKITPLPKSGSAMAWFELGDPQGTPLLCLHGLSVTGFFFEQFHEHFVANGIRAIAPCMLGGVHVPAEARTVADMTTELLELMDVLGVQRFDVMGFSWGTLPELALVARAPERVARAGFLGAMLPVDFLARGEVAELKSDVRLSLRMAGNTPRLHRALMWLVCRLPVAKLVEQFKDPSLSRPEADALAPGTAFNAQLSRCLDEGRRTGSRFFTDGWRMFLDAPDYALSDLSADRSRTELRLYVGEQDNVHLPSFASRIATARAAGQPPERAAALSDGVFRPAASQAGCSTWVAPGAGRMACMLYFKEALANLMAAPAEGGTP